MANSRRRLELQKAVVGEEHADYATGLNQLALLLIMHGDPVEAEPLLRQALAIRKDALGEDHADYATNLSSLAGLLWARGDLDAAEPLLRQALDIRWNVLGVDHPKTVASMSSLEQLLQMKHELSGDETHFHSDPRVHPEPDAGTTNSGGSLGDSDGHPDTRDDWHDTHSAQREEYPRETFYDEPAERTESPFAPSSRHWAEPEPEPEPEPEQVVETVTPSSSREPVYLPGLGERLDGLGRELAGLGEALSLAAEAMRTRGVPVPERLEDDLRSGRDRFDAAREDLARAAETLGLPGARVRALADREALAAKLAELVEAEERTSARAQTQRRALEVLDRVALLRHVEQREFPPLEECQARARRLREAIAPARPAELPDDAASLAAGTHPFSALLALASGDDQISDTLWTDLMDTVRDEFGRGLAVAVGRTRIILPRDTAAARP